MNIMNIKYKKIAAECAVIIFFIIVFALTVSAKNNIALECKIDSFCGDTIKGTAAMLVDKDPNYNTKWETSEAAANHFGQSHWVILDFGEEKTFDSVRLVKASQGAEDFGRSELDASGFYFEISSDAKNWVRILEVSDDGGNDIYEGSFPPATARYLSLVLTHPEQDENSSENQAVRLYDLKVFEYISPIAEIEYQEETTEEITETNTEEPVVIKNAPETSDSVLYISALFSLMLMPVGIYVITRIFLSRRSRWI